LTLCFYWGKIGTMRMIHSVGFNREKAMEHVLHLEEQGRRPRIHDRIVQAEKIARELREWVAKEIGPIAKPKDIRFGDNLPKTRSGKIMRRLLRSLAKNEDIAQDTSTLENPAILEQLKEVK